MNAVPPKTCPAHIVTFDPPLTTGGEGPLAGLRVAVKDNFDIAGQVTGGGNPEWAAAQQPAIGTARIVKQLLDLSVSITGKTQMDELAYSLMGQNARYGTPVNPAAPDRMPGGSSSGSASAVAAGLADVGLGTDTGGSVRIPASFCGLWGWRPTHGLFSADGLLPLAHSYDVPGFFTRDGETMWRVATALRPGDPQNDLDPRSPEDLWDVVDPATATALDAWRVGPRDALFDTSMMSALLDTFRICQGAEVADQFGDWIREANPDFGPGIRERFHAAIAMSPETRTNARLRRAAISEYVRGALGTTSVVILPTAPGPAPLLTTTGAEMEAYRNAALTILSIAGHAGLPQVSIPVATVEGAPVGLSLIGPPESDLSLIRLARRLFETPPGAGCDNTGASDTN